MDFFGSKYEMGVGVYCFWVMKYEGGRFRRFKVFTRLFFWFEAYFLSVEVLDFF